MICKLIKATVPPESTGEFLNRQMVWNAAMAKQPGFLHTRVATSADEPGVIYIFVDIESHEALESFMATKHDPLAAATRIDELYDKLEVKVLDVI